MKLASILRVGPSILTIASTGCQRSVGTPTPAMPPPFTEGDRAELLFLGVFHFDDKGLDTYKPKFKVDVLAPHQQRELDGLVGQLAAFRPTKIAVEARSADQPRLDSLYAAYVSSTAQLGPNEIYQVGFRLAKRLGLPKVFAVDAEARSYMTDDQARSKLDSLGVSMDALMARIRDDPWTRRYQQLYARDDSLKTVRPLAEHLLYLNSAERIRVGHGAYLIGSFKFGRDLQYLGPDDGTSWYNRNLRIFSNLQALTSGPNERILLIIGAGHVPILRFLAQSSPEHRLREVSEFVAP